MKNRGSSFRQAKSNRVGRDFASSLFARLARALQKSKVPYLLTGADAVSYYGVPRRSDDKDLVVMTNSSDDLKRLVENLRNEGFDLTGLDVGYNTIFDSGFRIDIKVKSEVEVARKVRLGGGLWLNLTTAENLVLMKLEFWDGKSFESNDAQDVMKILARQGKALDMGYVQEQALKQRTFTKLARIQEYLSRTS